MNTCPLQKISRDARILIILSFVCVFMLGSCGCSQQSSEKTTSAGNISEEKIEFTDSFGQRIELVNVAERILPLSSQSAELLITIGAEKKIVGVSDSIKNRPDIMQKIPDVPSVGSGSSPDIEKILSLKPDVIVTYQSYKPTNFDKLVGSNVTVIVLDCYKLETVSDDAFILGLISGNKTGADRYIRFNDKYKSLVNSRIENLSSKEILRVFGEYSDYTAIVRNSAGGQVIAALHAENIYGNNSIPEWPVVSPEWVLEQDPDIIVRSGENTGSNVTLKETHTQFITRTGYDKLQSGRFNRVYVYDKDLVSGPRTVIGLVYLAKIFYPDRFADIDPDAIRKEYVQEFGFGNESQDWIYPPFGSQTRDPGLSGSNKAGVSP